MIMTTTYLVKKKKYRTRAEGLKHTKAGDLLVFTVNVGATGGSRKQNTVTCKNLRTGEVFKKSETNMDHALIAFDLEPFENVVDDVKLNIRILGTLEG